MGFSEMPSEDEMARGPSWVVTEPGRCLSRCDVPDMVLYTELLSFVDTTIKTSFLMTVKVNGVTQDGTTTFIHNKVHNRTRTLTCAAVSALSGSFLSNNIESGQRRCGELI